MQRSPTPGPQTTTCCQVSGDVKLEVKSKETSVSDHPETSPLTLIRGKIVCHIIGPLVSKRLGSTGLMGLGEKEQSWGQKASLWSFRAWCTSGVSLVLFTSVGGQFSVMRGADQISCSVVSDSLRPHESRHTRPPCPSPTPGVHSDSRPSSQ